MFDAWPQSCNRRIPRRAQAEDADQRLSYQDEDCRESDLMLKTDACGSPKFC